MWGPVASFLSWFLHEWAQATTAFTFQQDTFCLLGGKFIIQTLKKFPFMLVIGMILTAKLLMMFFSTPVVHLKQNKPFNLRLNALNCLEAQCKFPSDLQLTVPCLISKIPSHVRFTLTLILERNKCSRVQTDVLRLERWFGRPCPCRL